VSLEDPTRALRLLAFHRESGVVGGGVGVGGGIGNIEGGGKRGSDTASINATESKEGNSVNVSNE
jgi:hypothetical protein